jgi:hypothetical protein
MRRKMMIIQMTLQISEILKMNLSNVFQAVIEKQTTIN